MSETCSCGAKFESDDIEQVREWRGAHRHEWGPVKVSPSGASASFERDGWAPVGFQA